MDIRPADILAAHRRLRGRVRETPLVEDPVLSQARGQSVRLKLECWQATGSFKLRGALNRVLTLAPEARARGLLAVSAGNHALGAAAHARRRLAGAGARPSLWRSGASDLARVS